MAELITFRELRKNLSANLKRMKLGEIFEVGGLLLTDIRTLGPNYEKGAKSLEDKIYAAAHAGKAEAIIFHGDGTQEIVQEVDGRAAKFLELKKQMDARATPDRFERVDNVYTAAGLGWLLNETLGDPYRNHCEKCKKPAECSKMTEDGIDHIVCEECAKKAKLQFNKLEKL